MTEKFRTPLVSFDLSFNSGPANDVLAGVSIATTGEAGGHHLVFDDVSLQQLQQLGNGYKNGVKSRFTHPDWLGISDGLGKYLGRVKSFRVEGDRLLGDLHISQAARNSPAGDLAGYVLSLAAEDPTAFGMSVVVDLDRVWITTDGQEVPTSGGKPNNVVGKFPVARIKHLHAADLVDEPALNPEGLFRNTRENYEGTNGLFQTKLNELMFQEVFNVDQVLTNLAKGDFDKMEEELLKEKVEKLESSISSLTEKIENSVIHIGGQPPRGQQVGSGNAQLDQFQGYFDWLFGAPGAKLPPPELRRADALYRAVTGDVEMRGIFDPTRVAFANANTTTLADLAVNAMNKVIMDLYTNLTAYRWYELITAVQATDGSLHDMQWLQFGGIDNLPVVAEGAAYTELAVVDTKETSAFTKYGGYVGITDKMLRNSEIDKLQAIPRSLTISAIRTRSAAIAGIFTQNAGVGPTMAQDSVALFHTVSHGNLATTAYSWTAWKAARLEAAKQAELGSAKRQVLWPRFLLVPVDLYDQALIDFGYGAGPGGAPGTPNNDVNPYATDRPGDARVTPIAVPEWTDTNDWAWIVDPKIAPVICMAYGDNPGGTTHPAPQLYSVTDPTSGLMFTNDTLPIKVRDYWAYGVATYRGVGKRNVA